MKRDKNVTFNCRQIARTRNTARTQADLFYDFKFMIETLFH